MTAKAEDWENAERATEEFIAVLTKWGLARNGKHRAACLCAWRDWVDAILRTKEFEHWFKTIENNRIEDVWSVTKPSSKLGRAVIAMQEKLAKFGDRATGDLSPAMKRFVKPSLYTLRLLGLNKSGTFQGFSSRWDIDCIEKELDEVLRKRECKRSEMIGFDAKRDGDPYALVTWELGWPSELRDSFQQAKAALVETIKKLPSKAQSRDLEAAPSLVQDCPEAREALLRLGEHGFVTSSESYELSGFAVHWRHRLERFKEWLRTRGQNAAVGSSTADIANQLQELTHLITTNFRNKKVTPSRGTSTKKAKRKSPTGKVGRKPKVPTGMSFEQEDAITTKWLEEWDGPKRIKAFAAAEFPEIPLLIVRAAITHSKARVRETRRLRIRK